MIPFFLRKRKGPEKMILRCKARKNWKFSEQGLFEEKQLVHFQRKENLKINQPTKEMRLRDSVYYVTCSSFLCSPQIVLSFFDWTVSLFRLFGPNCAVTLSDPSAILVETFEKLPSLKSLRMSLWKWASALIPKQASPEAHSLAQRLYTCILYWQG